VDVTASSKDELSDEIIVNKIMDTSGSASKVIDKSTGMKEGKKETGTGSSGYQKGKSSGIVEFGNKDELKENFSLVRNGQLAWILLTYEGGNGNTIILHSKGNGGADELVSKLTDDIVGYGLIRKIEQIDNSETVKFAFIRFVGDNVPRMLKARLGTHFGAVTEMFSPYHVSLDVTHTNEISDDIIMKLITNASGSSVHVLSDEQKPPAAARTSINRVGSGSTAPKGTSTNTAKVPAVPKAQEQVIKFVDKEGVKADIQDVRSDATSTDWALVGYEGGKGNTVIQLGKGSGGLTELLGLLQDNIVAYGLLRKTDKIDDSLTVKFVYLTWIGENIDRMHRARMGTHKGSINELFAPYHVDLIFTNKSEISDEIIMQKIQDASGSGSKVRA